MPDAERRFYMVHEAWTAQPNADAEIRGAAYNENGACCGEFSVRWREAGGTFMPCAEMYADAWRLFADWPGLGDLLAGIGLGANRLNPPTPADVRLAMLRAGFRDATERAQPEGATSKRTAADACRAVAADIRAAFPDLMREDSRQTDWVAELEMAAGAATA